MLPVFGSVRLDAADVADLEANGRLFDVVLHELGHVLGVGTLWGTHGLLQGAGTSDLPSSYVFVDDTIDPDQEYFYYVESISMSGVRERFTPIIRAPAKSLPATDSDDDEDAPSH